MTNHYEYQDFEFRGIFMTLFIDIEWILSDTISLTLVGENELQLDVMEFMTPNYMLDQKISLLRKVLKSRHKDIYKKYKGKLDELRSLGKLRNNFAHKKILLDNKKKILSFLQVRNQQIDTSINHSFVELEQSWEKLKEILKHLDSLLEDITKTKST